MVISVKLGVIVVVILGQEDGGGIEVVLGIFRVMGMTVVLEMRAVLAAGW